MNNARRKELETIAGQVKEAIAVLEGLKTDVEQAQSEEQDALDNLPDSFRDGEKGEKAQAAIEAMEEVMDKIQEAIDALEEVEGPIETAAE